MARLIVRGVRLNLGRLNLIDCIGAAVAMPIVLLRRWIGGVRLIPDVWVGASPAQGRLQH